MMRSAIGILLSTYSSRAAEGKNLGSAGYSYDFVVKQFLPLLQQCGEVVQLPPDRQALGREAERMREQALTPIHLCFMPFQHACLCDSVPNVVVPAWEFPDLPDHEFDRNPQNDWVATANRCAALIVGGPWTAEVFRRAGVTVPIHEVPVPTPAWNYSVADWRSAEPVTIECRATQCGGDAQPKRSVPLRQSAAARGGLPTALRSTIEDTAASVYKRSVRPLLPGWIDRGLGAAVRAARRARRASLCPVKPLDRLELSGVVYTSIFNPHDGRKNWEDLISGFVLALRNCPDATLVLKLIAQDRRAAEPVLAHYAQMQIDHACRLLFVTDFLTSDQMRELARATTYYVTSTRAEGNCLPLMDYLAAGRPAISPKHTAISDYFGTNAGFVVDSHPEPCSWPQDRSGRWRTSWHRIVWPSLADAFEKSYNLARNDAAAYCRLSAQARQTMQEWSHPELVVMRLRAVVEEIVSFESDAAGPTRIGNEALPERRAAA